MTEIWKNIAGWPLHQVSNMGCVRALPGAQVRRNIAQKIQLRILTTNVDGYKTIGRGRPFGTLYVHRLVLIAFRGLPPVGYEARHLNGDPADNRLSNLAWGSRKHNEADKVRHARSNRGTRNGQSLLSQREVNAIRKATGPRGIITKLALKYGVSHSTISMIRLGHRWPLTHEQENSK